VANIVATNSQRLLDGLIIVKSHIGHRNMMAADVACNRSCGGGMSAWGHAVTDYEVEGVPLLACSRRLWGRIGRLRSRAERRR
jgi:hypothetical protein